MKLLAVSDIHDSLENLKKIKNKTGNCDITIVAGDLTNFGEEQEAKKALDILRPCRILAIPGNLDTSKVTEALEKQNASIHRQKTTIDCYCLAGMGGGRIGEAGRVLYSEEQIAGTLSKLLQGEKNIILVTHAPPLGTKLDLSRKGNHAGSWAVRKAIEQFQPLLAISGHIHESNGTDKIGNTLCLNVAAVKEGRAAIIEIKGKKIDARFLKV